MPCPGKVHFIATVTTDGPAEVKYVWQWSDGSHGPEGSVIFTAAGSQKVEQYGTFGAGGQVHGWGQLKVVSPNSILSSLDGVVLQCQ